MNDAAIASALARNAEEVRWICNVCGEFFEAAG
jgi:rubrerythrin